MVYYPSNAKIPDKVCIVQTYKNHPTDMYIYFSAKITEPPQNTIAVMENNFFGPFEISKIRPSTGSFYAQLKIKNVINSKKDIVLVAGIQHWALNEIFFSGVVQNGGVFGDDVGFVAVTYGPHSSIILKGYEIYNNIKGIK